MALAATPQKSATKSVTTPMTTKQQRQDDYIVQFHEFLQNEKIMPIKAAPSMYDDTDCRRMMRSRGYAVTPIEHMRPEGTLASGMTMVWIHLDCLDNLFKKVTGCQEELSYVAKALESSKAFAEADVYHRGLKTRRKSGDMRRYNIGVTMGLTVGMMEVLAKLPALGAEEDVGSDGKGPAKKKVAAKPVPGKEDANTKNVKPQNKKQAVAMKKAKTFLGKGKAKTKVSAEREDSIPYSKDYEQKLGDLLGQEVRSTDIVKTAMDEELSFEKFAELVGEDLQKRFPINVKKIRRADADLDKDNQIMEVEDDDKANDGSDSILVPAQASDKAKLVTAVEAFEGIASVCTKQENRFPLFYLEFTSKPQNWAEMRDYLLSGGGVIASRTGSFKVVGVVTALGIVAGAICRAEQPHEVHISMVSWSEAVRAKLREYVFGKEEADIEKEYELAFG